MRDTDEIGRNDPCPCGATKRDGTPKKWKTCCGNEAAKVVWIFDHPRIGDVWDTKAANEETARAAFALEWDNRVVSGHVPPGARFGDGVIQKDVAALVSRGFECPKGWKDLERTGIEGVRHCQGCKRDVYAAKDEAELKRHFLAGFCASPPQKVFVRCVLKGEDPNEPCLVRGFDPNAPTIWTPPEAEVEAPPS